MKSPVLFCYHLYIIKVFINILNDLLFVYFQSILILFFFCFVFYKIILFRFLYYFSVIVQL